MSYLLPHLHKGFAVDQAILTVSLPACQPAPAPPAAQQAGADRHCAPQEEDRVVCMRFGHDWDQSCMQMDEARSPVTGHGGVPRALTAGCRRSWPRCQTRPRTLRSSI